MKKQFEAITKITKALEGLTESQSHNVLNFVQSALHEERRVKLDEAIVKEAAEITANSEPVEEVEKKKSPAKKAKKPAKKKDPVVTPTLEEMMELCRDTANKLKSGEKVKALIQDSCGVGSLKEVEDTACFIDLKKKLEDA